MPHKDAAIAALREKQIPRVHQAASDAAHLSSRLTELSARLETLSQTIIEEFENHQDMNNAESSKLWHDLNGLQHLIEQFHHHTDIALNDFKRQSLALINALQSTRPEKK